ncbi:hypothetical protein HQ487_05060 [Candidatus Uhrbacteria bacterium]|nr:hypothetical protein [Candidatus Uhrbacteria bacterium]
MVKDIRPIDLESSGKQESVILNAESKEIPLNSEPTPETSVSPEVSVEQSGSETSEQSDSEPSGVGEVPSDALLTATSIPVAVQKKETDRLEEEIEDILEEDLKELYVAMPADKQAEFREKGEETRSRIRVLVGSAKVNAKKIFGLIRSWLQIVPGVNKFFLEQEAKIKTDKILFVTEEEKRKQNENV